MHTVQIDCREDFISPRTNIVTLPCGVTACTNIFEVLVDKSAPHGLPLHGSSLSHAAASLKYSLQQQQQGRVNARPGVYEGKEVVGACCALGRGAAGSPMQQ
eukprot:1136811-Pelagomonas_calceolata.AAC.10